MNSYLIELFVTLDGITKSINCSYVSTIVFFYREIQQVFCLPYTTLLLLTFNNRAIHITPDALVSDFNLINYSRIVVSTINPYSYNKSSLKVLCDHALFVSQLNTSIIDDQYVFCGKTNDMKIDHIKTKSLDDVNMSLKKIHSDIRYTSSDLQVLLSFFKKYQETISYIKLHRVILTLPCSALCLAKLRRNISSGNTKQFIEYITMNELPIDILVGLGKIGSKYIDVFLIDPAYQQEDRVDLDNIFNLSSQTIRYPDTKLFTRSFSLNSDIKQISCQSKGDNNLFVEFISDFHKIILQDLGEVVVIFHIIPFKSEYVFLFFHQYIYNQLNNDGRDVFPINGDITIFRKQLFQTDAIDVIHILVM
jgi:hypothetical protein